MEEITNAVGGAIAHVMRHISIHYNDVVSSSMFHTMDISSTCRNAFAVLVLCELYIPRPSFAALGRNTIASSP